MGFNSFRNSPQALPSPAQVIRNWKGGKGQLTFNIVKESEDGTKSYEEHETELPLEVAILEVTNDLNKTTFKVMRDGRRVPDKSYFSTEKIGFDDPMILSVAEYVDGERQVSEVARGSYKAIKDSTDVNGMYRQILYVWNYATEQIERIQLTGAGRAGWFSFLDKLKKDKRQNAYYNSPVKISKNPEVKHSPASDYYEPMFELGVEYNEQQVEFLKEKDNEVVEYLKSLQAKNMARINGNGDGLEYSGNQEPRQYDGEGSQEVPEDGQISLEDVPF